MLKSEKYDATIIKTNKQTALCRDEIHYGRGLCYVIGYNTVMLLG